jgi:hypothetical protein
MVIHQQIRTGNGEGGMGNFGRILLQLVWGGSGKRASDDVPVASGQGGPDFQFAAEHARAVFHDFLKPKPRISGGRKSRSHYR